MSGTRFVIVFLFLASWGLAQEHTIRVDRFDLEDGLSHNQVHWIHKDSGGMMWIGTANGINRYDGKSFELVAAVNFFYTDNKKVVEDLEGDLWLMKNYWNSELFFFNIHTGKIKSLEEKFGTKLSVQEVSTFKVIGLSDGSIIFRDTKGTFYEYEKKGSLKELTDFENSIIKLLAVPGSSEFWGEYKEAISDSGKGETITGVKKVCLFRKDKEGNFHKKLSVDIPIDNEIVGVTKEKSLLMFSEGKQLVEIDEEGGKTIRDFSFISGELKNESEISLVYDEQKDRFLNCVDGVLTIFSRGDTTEVLKTKTYDELKTFRFSSVLVEENIVWVGTTYGLTKIQINSSPFKKIAYKDPYFFGPEEYESCRMIADYIGADQFTFHLLLLKNKKSRFGRNTKIEMSGFGWAIFTDFPILPLAIVLLPSWRITIVLQNL